MSLSLRADSALDSSFLHDTAPSTVLPLDIHKKHFRNFDQDEVFTESLDAITHSGNCNFVVDFCDDNAWVGCNLNEDVVTELVGSGGSQEGRSTRWIDISCPVNQKPLIEKLALHYDFSPRLLVMICSEPLPGKVDSSSHQLGSGINENVACNQGSLGSTQDSDLTSIFSNNPARTGNLYALLDEVWNYTTVDQARNYMCLGYNTIYTIAPDDRSFVSPTCQTRTPLPNCVRVWTWLFLCTDRTIITINEDLFPFRGGKLTDCETRLLVRTKQNTIGVFKSLSQANNATSSLPLLPIRRRLSEKHSPAADLIHDAPGLLFYFLFENWFNSYSLVTKRDSRYQAELSEIRTDMFKRPRLGHIDMLDKIGSELGALKRHYQSYIRIIDRIIDNHSGTKPSALDGSRVTWRIELDADTQSGVTHGRTSQAGGSSVLGVDPGMSARARFERLKDMILLYALSEVEDYLERKKSLVDMNFQLIAIKESQDVDRLTRVSLLITKATILFLPVNLMTSYFGATIQNQQFTLQQYWLAFAMLLVLSLALLVGFGVFSGTLERWTFFPVLRNLAAKLQTYKQKRAKLSPKGDV